MDFLIDRWDAMKNLVHLMLEKHLLFTVLVGTAILSIAIWHSVSTRKNHE